MMNLDSVELVTGVSIMIVTPALVEVAKQMGLPVKFAGMASILFAMMLLAVGGIAAGVSANGHQVATWILAGFVYGLAAAGLYSQTRLGGGAGA